MPTIPSPRPFLGHLALVCCTGEMDEVLTQRDGIGDEARESDLSRRETASTVLAERNEAEQAVLQAGEQALVEREAAVTAREAALAQRMEAAREILAAADERDAISDSRDIGGDTREQVIDRAHFLATGDRYGDDLPLRRGAALDRQHAKGDRAASHDDRAALTEEPEVP